MSQPDDDNIPRAGDEGTPYARLYEAALAVLGLDCPHPLMITMEAGTGPGPCRKVWASYPAPPPVPGASPCPPGKATIKDRLRATLTAEPATAKAVCRRANVAYHGRSREMLRALVDEGAACEQGGKYALPAGAPVAPSAMPGTTPGGAPPVPDGGA